MGISLSPQYLKHYKDIAQLLVKYGHSDLLSSAGLDDVLTEEERKDPKEAAKAEELAQDLERMGPIYVKLGQVLSARSDLLPEPYVRALTRLQDKLEPVPTDQVEQIVHSELGVRISKAFLEFEPKPIATASLGQVHRAALRNGRPVAVKVQRPGIRERIAEDMEVLESIAEFVDAHTEAGKRFQFSDVLEEFRKNLVRELDYRQEAHNLAEFNRNLQEFEHVLVPSPVEDYTTSRVLTMDYIRGKKITSLSPLRRLEMDGSALAEELFRAYLKQILVDGLFHADPHAGNVFITDDNRIALIDLGMIGRLGPQMQDQILKILLAVSEGRSDEVADIAIRIGALLPHFDERRFRSSVAGLVDAQQSATIATMQIGRSIMELSRVSGESGIRLPAELTMLSKALLNLDEIGRTLDPEFEPNASIRRNSVEIMRQRLVQSLSPGNLFAAAMEAREFAQELPRRVNRILDLVSQNQFKINVEAIDENTLIEGFQKVANRIALGLVLASLIIGASMLMRVNTRFHILGYPGFAMVLFLSAAGLGFWLVVHILLTDRHAQK